MTRTARRGSENKKKHEGTEWESLKPLEQAPPSRSDAQHKASGQQPPGKKGRKNWSQGLNGENILHKMMAQKERSEKRRQKRQDERKAKKRCFKCRLTGHKVEDCLMSEAADQGTGICYRCGSSEHSSVLCKAKGPKDHMPFASCYVCGKKGHLARACPDNPQGLYPKGGGCRTCGSVHHFQRDCPEFLAQQGIGSKTLTMMDIGQSVDAVDDGVDRSAGMTTTTSTLPHSDAKKKKKPKVIKF
ncbi:hypothetical protein ACOMHN_048495 [Nucella lapillus]